MAFSFLIDLESYPPKFLSKLSKDEVTVFKSISFDSAVVSSHQDRIYNYSIEKCQDLDCSQFYTSSFTSGFVSLCGDCPPFSERDAGDEASGPCTAFNHLEAINYGNIQQITGLFVSNSENTQNLLSAYNTWATGGSATLGVNNSFIAGAGYWIGLDVCNGGGNNYQCVVNCTSGSVAGCWNRSSGSGAFGSVYNIGGQNFQVYDPIQIWLSGLRPNGGSFPLLNSNPLSGSSSGNDCGTSYTTVGNGNCLTRQNPSNNDENDNVQTCPIPDTDIGGDFGTPESGNGPFTLVGDFGGGAFSLNSGGCGYAGNVVTNAPMALGGSIYGNVSSFQQAGVINSYSSCQACLEGLLDENSENVPTCCEVSYGAVTVNGAPAYNASNEKWGSGSGAWLDWIIIPSDLPPETHNSLFSNSCFPIDGELANATGIPCREDPPFNGFDPSNSCGPGDFRVTGQWFFVNCDNEVYGAMPYLTRGTSGSCEDCPEQDVWEETFIYPPSGSPPFCVGVDDGSGNLDFKGENEILKKRLEQSMRRGGGIASADGSSSGFFDCPQKYINLPGGFGIRTSYNKGDPGYIEGECCGGAGTEELDNPGGGDGNYRFGNCQNLLFDPPRAF